MRASSGARKRRIGSFMLIVFGTRFYGRIKECGGSFLATRFVHVWYVPIIPVGTELVLEQNGSSYRAVPAPFSFTSVIAGYLRVWGVLGGLGAGMFAVGAIQNAIFAHEDMLDAIFVAAFASIFLVLLLGATVAAYVWMGKLSPDERRMRSVYQLHVGRMVDPADMGHARHALRDGLFATVTGRAQGLAGMGYRLNADPAYAWPDVALDPTVTDEVLITGAFTLARVISSLGGPYATQMKELHGKLWQRIMSAAPPYLAP